MTQTVKVNKKGNGDGNGSVRFDATDAQIIQELLDDSYASSTAIAGKMKLPLSTVQRRRAILERSMLKKSYSIDLSKFGLRVVKLHIHAKGGVNDEVAMRIFQQYPNVLSASVEIDSVANVVAKVYVRDSLELHTMMEAISRMPETTSVEFTETVVVVGKRGINLNDYAVSRKRRVSPTLGN